MSKKKGNKNRPTSPNDLGTPELRSHGDYIQEKIGTGRRTRNRAVVPLDYYYNRKIIDQRQYEAGLKWESDYYKAVGSPKVTASYEKDIVHSSNPLEATESQIHHLVRFRKAKNSIDGTTARDIAFHIICIGNYASDLFDKFEYYNTSTQFIPVIKQALDRLAKFYSIPYYAKEIEKEKN